MSELRPVLTGALFAEIRRELVSLLNGLNEAEWKLPTAAPEWNVKDVALHILGGDVGNLSRRRDGFSMPADLSSYEKLVAFINDLNASWVVAGRRMSTRLLVDLLEHVGRQADEYFASLDPYAPGGPVEWAGSAAPQWLDVAREYTERWHHQQQIRDATGRPGLYEPRWFEPVLDTFVRALPRTFRDVQAPTGAAVQVAVTGAIEKTWTLQRFAENWGLCEGGGENSEAVVTLPAEKAWKIFTKGIRGEEALTCAEIRGDRALGERVLQMVAVIG